MIEVEVTRYELISFMNATTAMMQGIRVELRGLRLTALQNRLVLDQLTAMQGGVCAVVGSTCCTYIPDNDADGHIIEQALKNITEASRRLGERETSAEQSFFEKIKSLFTSVEHYFVLGMILLLIVGIILCMLPCLMMMVRQAI
ncbi:hypothetical protein HF521_020111, partial [Silurus meridionalis]